MPVASLHKPISLPETDVFSFLFRRPHQLCPGNQVIFQDANDANRTYTFKDLEAAAIDLGAGLRDEFNVQKGDTVAIVSPNDVEVPAVAFGAISIGAIAVVMNPSYTEGELTYQLEKINAKLVLSHTSALTTVKKVCQRIGFSESRIFLLGLQDNSTKHIKHWQTIRRKGSTFVPPQIAPKKDLAFIQFSSGTTGMPKGVMVTHHNASSNLLQMLKQAVGREYTDTFLGFGTLRNIPCAPPDGDKILGCVPFFHTFGMSQLAMLGVFLGVTTIVMEKFEPEKWCCLVQKHKITTSFLVPAMGLQLLKHPQVPQYNLKTIRILTFAASPLRKELADDLYHRLGLRAVQGYGSTEMSPVSFISNWENWHENMGSCGSLVPNMEVKFCHIGEDFCMSQFSELHEVPEGHTGELFCRGPNVFPGYWKDFGATAECVSTNGWFRTGDVGYMNQQGLLHITDRAKELIKYKGFQVAPAELEAILTSHNDVEDAAVVGILSDQDGTEVPRAYIVRRGGMRAIQSGDGQRLADWLAEKVIHYKKLRGGLKFVEAIPRNANGKIVRRTLKDFAQKEFDDEVSRRPRSKL